jgi:hypothetical protein
MLKPMLALKSYVLWCNHTLLELFCSIYMAAGNALGLGSLTQCSYRLRASRFPPVQDLPLLHNIQTDSGAQPVPIQWVPVALPLGVKQQKREADYSASSSAEVKKSGAIPPLPPYVFNFTFTVNALN